MRSLSGEPTWEARSADAFLSNPEARVLDRRRLLVTGALLIPAALSVPACSARGQSSAVSLPDFRHAGDPDDTAALYRAFASGQAVHARAGGGSGPDGAYRVASDATANLPSGATLFGDGIDRTIILRTPGSRPFILHCDSGSADPTRNIAGLRFRDLTFGDDVARLGFSEFSYLVMLNGVSDVRFDRVGFRGFRGDGLHLGSSVTSAVERHNRDIVVSDCTFDGVNANNRNGISVIDAARLLIEHSRFLNVSRRGNGTAGRGDPLDPATGPAQPGAIDLEPNGDAFSIVRDVSIRNNQFIGGGGFAVSMLLPPNDALRTPINGITVAGNVVRGRAGGFEAFGFRGDGAVQSDRSYGITIRDNDVEGCDKPFIVNGIRGITIDDNVFRDCREHAELGYQDANAAATLSGNTFDGAGNASGFLLWLREGEGITITGNRFLGTGSSDGGAGTAIAVVSGTLRRLTVRNNQIRSPNGAAMQPAAVFKGAGVDQSSLILTGNGAADALLRRALMNAP